MIGMSTVRQGLAAGSCVAAPIVVIIIMMVRMLKEAATLITFFSGMKEWYREKEGERKHVR